jgi:hypothetical protein
VAGVVCQRDGVQRRLQPMWNLAGANRTGACRSRPRFRAPTPNAGGRSRGTASALVPLPFAALDDGGVAAELHGYVSVHDTIFWSTRIGMVGRAGFGGAERGFPRPTLRRETPTAPRGSL